MSGDEKQGSLSSRDRVVAMYGERSIPALPDEFPQIVERLIDDEAVGLILVDATPLSEIEVMHGAQSFRKTLDTLAGRLRARLAREVGDSFRMTAGTLEEEHILIFLHRPRSDREFYGAMLPRLANDLRDYVELCLKRIVYPYLTELSDIAVAHGSCFHRPFQRPETQIRWLIEETLRSAHAVVDRIGRERGERLRRILCDENLSTVYEPIVQLKDRTTIGYEALTRGPVGSGLETPQKLFSIANQFNLEYELDNLCRRMALKNADGIRSGDRLFLNILPTSIHDPEFGKEDFQRTLERLGLAPQSLVLEVSERQAISNYPIFREAIDHFLKLGFGIALDDTGAGYASLEAALELNPDFLKVDMSLIRGIDDNPQKQELLSGLQRLASRMDATVIAEGIETEAELTTVRELGCTYGQGYAIGRGTPMCRAPSAPPAEDED
ncbi:MAG: EAL domain-containing protein [Deltaproteobacteria bacterium]|nr:EAL domain-containing protein [Deltaproteobacteria bacterium]